MVGLATGMRGEPQERDRELREGLHPILVVDMATAMLLPGRRMEGNRGVGSL
jgi:hypothetical protein